MRRVVASHLVWMLALTAAMVLIGAFQKAPCASRIWVENDKETAFLCDSDIPHLWRWEQLGGGRLPYLDVCVPAEHVCDEYPVATMYAMRGIASLTGDAGDPYPRFYWASTALLLLCALLTTWCLEKMGARTLLFAAAPVLAVTGTTNWDLLPVALATFATLAFFRRRDSASGVLLGLGAVVKLYPITLVLPFGLERIRRGDKARAAVLLGAAGVVFLGLNVPFAALAFDGWSTFFRFNADRPADYDSLWAVACQFGVCPPIRIVNLGSIALAVVGTAWAWRLATRRRPDLPRWAMAFPLLVMVLLTSKVWSPQYSLWLLPWFAFTRIRTLTFLQYQIAEVLEFLVRYAFFGTLISGEGVPYGVLAAVVVLRAVLLLRCLGAWVRDPCPVVAGSQSIGAATDADDTTPQAGVVPRPVR